MSVSAMKQALEALVEANEISKGPYAICLPAEIDTAMDALRQAIAEAEKIVPSNYPNSHQQEPDDDIYDIWVEQGTCQQNRQVAKSATTEWVKVGTRLGPSQDQVGTRIWVGLTEQDVHDAFQFTELVKQLSFDRERPEWCQNFAAYLEAKLKEKNVPQP